MQEFLIVYLFLCQLFFCQTLFLINQWQRRNYHLRVFPHQIVSECNKVNIQSLHFPAHWVRMHDDHEWLASDHLANFGSDQLIYVCHIYLRIGFLVQNGKLGLASRHRPEGIGAAHAADAVVKLFVLFRLQLVKKSDWTRDVGDFPAASIFFSRVNLALFLLDAQVLFVLQFVHQVLQLGHAHVVQAWNYLVLQSLKFLLKLADVKILRHYL